MFERKKILIVLDWPDDGVSVFQKHAVRAKIVCRRVKADNEILREQVFAEHFIVAVRINENVGERCGGIADIAAPLEHLEQVANLPVDPGDFALPVLGIDRGIVSFVVDQEHGGVDCGTVAAPAMLFQPFEKILEGA